MKEFEKRCFTTDVELRAADDKPKQLFGVVKVNIRSVNLGGFVEMIMPGAFNSVMDQDVRALKNHDPNLVLGRTKSNTMRMQIDDAGNLVYEVDLPDTTAGRDIQVEVSRGDIDATSFAFRVAPNGERWVEEDDGTVLRQITAISLLRDLSPVTYPAYPDDEISLRGAYEKFKKEHQPEDPNDDMCIMQKKLHLIKIND